MSSIANKISQIAENSTRLYQAGYDKAMQENNMEYFKASFLGNDMNRYAYQVPFKPDWYMINTSSAKPHSMSNSLYFAIVNFNAYSKYCGTLNVNKQNGITTVKVPTSKLGTVFSYNNDTQEVIVDMSSNASYVNIKFRSDVRYELTAVKFPNRSKLDNLIEDISLLPDDVPSGNSNVLDYNKNVIDQIITPEDWDELIGTKPNWTFNLV